jgi:hypothetical protein
MALCNIPNLQSLLLADGALESAGLAELAPALYHNTSIKLLAIAGNRLDDMESAEILGDIIRRDNSVTILLLARIAFGGIAGPVDYIAEGLGSSSTLLKINLSNCALRDPHVSILSQTLGSRNTVLQKLWGR